ncbi:MAG: acetate--CoA ligase family protein [Actinomycetota bacterium]
MSGTLTRMLEARSVAVVGASANPGSSGDQMMKQLIAGGFEGPIAPVNPKYEVVRGHTCFPTLADVPFDVDLALLGVPNAVLEEQMRAAAGAGVAGVVIFASGLEEQPSDPSLIERLRAIANDAGIAVCGSNCMGFANFDHRLRALAFEEPEDLVPGPIAWITHSGSAFSALLHNQRGLRFNLAVSAGQELNVTVADYMAYALEKPTTKVVALFLEAVRDPQGFVAALRTAAERDVPVVALKVGRAAAARTLVTAHSGALAGEDGAFEALFEGFGVMRVETLNEMADTLELVVSGRRAGPGGLAAIHDSGGERAHLVDLAAGAGVRFARISEATRARLESVLEPGLPAVNPLDAWGTGNEFDRIFLECTRTLTSDSDTAAFAFAVDLAGEDLEWGYANVVRQAFRESELPFALVSNLASAIDPLAAARLRAAGIPVLEDAASGLRAFGHLFDRRDFIASRSVPGPPPVADEIRARWAERLAEPSDWSDLDALRMLSDYGVPTVASEEAASLDAALEAAERIGWPVALKTASGFAHKTESEGVVLGIDDEESFLRAYRELAGRLGPHVLVQSMAPAGVEAALGIVRDAQFGPLVMVAAGGILVEVLGDRRLALPPLNPPRARRMIDGLALRPLFDGARANPAGDVPALADALVRLSRLASDLGESLDALDANPVIVHPGGCVAVDALVVPRARSSTPASR